MRRLLLALALALLLAGCADAARHGAAVQKEFPQGRVFAVDDVGYRWVVLDADGSLWYVETIATDLGRPEPKVKSKAKLFTPEGK